MKVIVLITLFIFPQRPSEAVRQQQRRPSSSQLLPSSTTPISAQINNHEGLGVEQEFLNKIQEAQTQKPFQTKAQQEAGGRKHRPSNHAQRKKVLVQEILDYCKRKESFLRNAETAGDIIEDLRDESPSLDAIKKALDALGLDEFQKNVMGSCRGVVHTMTRQMDEARERVMQKVKEGKIVLNENNQHILD